MPQSELTFSGHGLRAPGPATPAIRGRCKSARQRPKLVLVTSWDDGHPLDLRIAELLSKHGLAGTFYVPARSARPLLHSRDIRRLSETFEIGAHGMESCELTKVTSRTAYSEIFESKQWAEDITGKPCRTFCFPKGRFARRHLRIAKQAGYAGVRTVELMSLGWPARVAGLDVIPTTVQAFARSPWGYFRNFAKRLNFANACRYVRYARSADWVSAATAVLASAAKSGGVFHLWGHSWEIEEAGQWSALEEILAGMAAYRKDASCLTNAELCDYGK